MFRGIRKLPAELRLCAAPAPRCATIRPAEAPHFPSLFSTIRDAGFKRGLAARGTRFPGLASGTRTVRGLATRAAIGDRKENGASKKAIDDAGRTVGDTNNGRITPKEVLKEARVVAGLALPIASSYLLSTASQSTSLFYLGHLGADALAAAALGMVFCNVTGFAVLAGLGTGLDTLCSQTATSNTAKPGALGVLLQRGWVLLLFACVPIAFAWGYAGEVLELLGMGKVAKGAGEYCSLARIALIPLALTEPLRRFLQSQSIMRASPLSSLLALCLTFPLNHLLVSNNYSWSLGMLGAPLVYGIVSWVNAGFLYGYARFASGVWKQNWPGWVPKRVFTRAGFSALLLLGLPGVLQVGAEWWAWEASSLMAGWMGTESLAAQSVLMTVSTVTYCIPLGLSVAASVRIGNLLGSATPHPARAASLASLFLSILFGLSNAAFLQSTRNFWGPLLTSSEPVQKLVAETIPLAAAFQVNDGIAAVGGGVMRGCGYQTLGAIYAGLGFYALGLPLGYLLAFKTNWSDAIRGNFSVTSTDGEEKGEGLKGLWRGLTVGLCAMSLLQTRFVWRLDMGKEVLKARARVGTAQVAKKVTDVG